MPRFKSDDSLIGSQLGDYVLTRVLATGGMARIYEGVDHKLKRHAAVKVLDDDKLANDEMLTQRFQREARAIAQLEHPNIITIYQYGEQDGVYFLAMKLIRGNDLAQELSLLRQAGERMEVDTALHVLEQIAAALDTAHNANIVHRDVKPSNILLDQTHHAILTDFGLVYQPSIDTTSGTSFGTPRYIAPEQAMSSGNALPQSDLYSLGVIAYQMLVGQTPFTGESPMELALAHISTPPPPPRSINPDIPEAAERELLKVLDKDPENRHASAGEFVAALRRAYAKDMVLSDARAISLAMPSQPVVENVTALAPAEMMPSPPALPKRRGIPAIPLLVGLLLLALATIFLLLPGRDPADGGVSAEATDPALTSATNEAVTDSSILVNSEPETFAINLVYTDAVFAIVNPNEGSFATSGLLFERDQDTYSGENIVRQTLPGGRCFRLLLQGRQIPLPAGCGRLHAEILLPDPLTFFWRSKPESASAFNVFYRDQLVATCPTADRGSEHECALSLTVPPAG